MHIYLDGCPRSYPQSKGGSMSAEFHSMSKRIKAASTLAEILKLENSIERCWIAGCFSKGEFIVLDRMILQRKMRFD